MQRSAAPLYPLSKRFAACIPIIPFTTCTGITLYSRELAARTGIVLVVGGVRNIKLGCVCNHHTAHPLWFNMRHARAQSLSKQIRMTTGKRLHIITARALVNWS